MEAPDYRRLEQECSAAGLALRPAEAHGLLCGLLGTGDSEAEQRWLDELLEDTDAADLLVQECRQSLQQLYAATCVSLNQAEFRVRTLLPDDDRPLGQRSRALAEWCQGYLYGFGLSGGREEMLSAESREALSDLSQIANLAPEQREAGEAEEVALVELVEFVWVAVMLIFQDLRAGSGDRL